MFDVHCHILPGMDDGPGTLQEALAMCRIAWDDGIRGIVATPHHGNGVYCNARKDILAAVAVLNEAVRSEGMDLTVYPGAEVHFNEKLPEGIVSGEICTCADAGKYLLVEPPVQVLPPGFKELVFQLKLAGITVIIAHPERNRAVQEDTRLLAECVNMGALCQITAQSVLGAFGSRAETTARLLIRSRLAHCVASDAHSATSRPPKVRAAMEVVSELLRDDPLFFAFMQELPGRVALGEPPAEPPACRDSRAPSSPSLLARLRAWMK